MIGFFNSITLIDADLLTKMGEKARFLSEKEYNEPKILKLLQTRIEEI